MQLLSLRSSWSALKASLPFADSPNGQMIRDKFTKAERESAYMHTGGFLDNEVHAACEMIRNNPEEATPKNLAALIHLYQNLQQPMVKERVAKELVETGITYDAFVPQIIDAFAVDFRHHREKSSELRCQNGRALADIAVRNERYAEKAIRMLDAWAVSCEDLITNSIRKKPGQPGYLIRTDQRDYSCEIEEARDRIDEIAFNYRDARWLERLRSELSPRSSGMVRKIIQNHKADHITAEADTPGHTPK